MSPYKCSFRIYIIFYHRRPFNKTAATLVRPHPFSTLWTTPLEKMWVCWALLGFRMHTKIWIKVKISQKTIQFFGFLWKFSVICYNHCFWIYHLSSLDFQSDGCPHCRRAARVAGRLPRLMEPDLGPRGGRGCRWCRLVAAPPPVRGVLHVLYCTVLYCTVLYCTRCPTCGTPASPAAPRSSSAARSASCPASDRSSTRTLTSLFQSWR